MPTPIGLAGLRGSGKDASFQFIHEWADERGVLARRRGFADALKFSFARIFLPDCSVDEAVIWCDEIKFTGTLEIYWGMGDMGHETRTEITHKISGRTALQRYGTECHRDVFGDDFWVDVLFPLGRFDGEELLGDDSNPVPRYPANFRGVMDQFAPEICVATDVRFDNEAKRVKLLDGLVVQIIRPDLFVEDHHRSELGISADLIHSVIINDGTLEDLRDKVFAWCEKHLSPIYPAATVFE